jgi:hypothetical protein
MRKLNLKRERRELVLAMRFLLSHLPPQHTTTTLPVGFGRRYFAVHAVSVPVARTSQSVLLQRDVFQSLCFQTKLNEQIVEGSGDGA